MQFALQRQLGLPGNCVVSHRGRLITAAPFKPLPLRPVPVVLASTGGNDGSSIGGNGGSGGGGGGGGNGGQGGDGEQKKGPSPELMAIMAAAGKTVDSFPADFKLGLLAGKVTPEILKRYLMFESNWLAKPVWGIAGEDWHL